MQQICLRQVPSEGHCRVAQIRAGGELGQRIRDMGLTPGAELSIIGRAPLRDPVAIRIRNYTLMLRNSEADFIFVEDLTTSDHDQQSQPCISTQSNED